MIRLYFANLQKYHEGFLDGKWYDLEDYTDIDGLMRDVAIDVLHQNLNEDGEPFFEYGISQEEWAIHDYEAPFKVTEYESISSIEAMIAFCLLDEDEQDKASYLYDNGHWGTLQESIDHTDDVIFYKGMTLEDVAAFIGMSYNYVRNELQNAPDFPPRLDRFKSPRWSRDAIAEWAKVSI